MDTWKVILLFTCPKAEMNVLDLKTINHIVNYRLRSFTDMLNAQLLVGGEGTVFHRGVWCGNLWTWALELKPRCGMIQFRFKLQMQFQ